MQRVAYISFAAGAQDLKRYFLTNRTFKINLVLKFYHCTDSLCARLMKTTLLFVNVKIKSNIKTVVKSEKYHIQREFFICFSLLFFETMHNKYKLK